MFNFLTISAKYPSNSVPAKKREILKLILLNCTLDGNSVFYDLQKPFFLFKDMKYLEKPKIEWLEPLDYDYVTTKVGF